MYYRADLKNGLVKLIQRNSQREFILFDYFFMDKPLFLKSVFKSVIGNESLLLQRIPLPSFRTYHSYLHRRERKI